MRQGGRVSDWYARRHAQKNRQDDESCAVSRRHQERPNRQVPRLRRSRLHERVNLWQSARGIAREARGALAGLFSACNIAEWAERWRVIYITRTVENPN